MGLLTKIEEVISNPLEKIHASKGFQPVDLARLVFRSLEKGVRKSIKKVYAPNRFLVLLHPKDHQDIAPFAQLIRVDIMEEMQRIVRERGYTLAGKLEIEFLSDKDVSEGLPQARAHILSQQEPASEVSYSPGEAGVQEECFEDPPTTIILSNITVKSGDSGSSCRAPFCSEGPAVSGSFLGERLAPEDLAIDFSCSSQPSSDNSETGFSPEVNMENADSPAGRDGESLLFLGSLEIKPGIRFLFSNQGVFVDNRNRDSLLTINGVAKAFTRLQDGARIRLNGTEMTFYG